MAVTITVEVEQLRQLAYVLYDAGHADEAGSTSLRVTDGLINTLLTQTRAEWALRQQREQLAEREHIPRWLAELRPTG